MSLRAEPSPIRSGGAASADTSLDDQEPADERIHWSETVRPEINAHLGAELVVEGETWPVFVWTIDHPAGRVLVDTGMIDSRPEVEDMSPTPHPENIPRDVVCVVNTHLHFDHCGGNRLFPGVPIHVQARELADARSLDDYTIRQWVDFDGATYVEHEGEAELLPGIRLLPAPGHTDGHQVVVVETDVGRIVLGGDVGTSFDELASGRTEGQRRVLALRAPTWLSHAPTPPIPVERHAGG
jgi:N-acyl homoserine lactone hydrolase